MQPGFKFSNYSIGFIILILSIVTAIVLINNIKPNIGSDLNQVTGKIASSVYIAIIENITCTTQLESGWNLFSVYCSVDNMSRSYVLSNLNDSFYSVHTYFANDTLDKWKAYNPSLPEWVVHDLNTIYVQNGYWIYLYNSSMIFLNGTIKRPGLVILENGWNLVGFQHNESTLINKSFINVLNLDTIYMYNSSDTLDPWKIYVTGANDSQNDLIFLTPTYGYWVKVNGSAVWVIEE